MTPRDWRYVLTVWPLALAFCVGVWAGLVWVITRFAS